MKSKEAGSHDSVNRKDDVIVTVIHVLTIFPNKCVAILQYCDIKKEFCFSSFSTLNAKESDTSI